MNDDLKQKLTIPVLVMCIVIMSLQLFSIMGTRDWSVSIPKLLLNIVIGAVAGGIAFGVMKVIGK